jgi:hypothetical protein
MASDVAIYSYQTFGLIIRLSHNLKPKPGCYLDQKGFFLHVWSNSNKMS